MWVVHIGLNIVGKKEILVIVGIHPALTVSVKRNIIELVIGDEVIVC